MKRFDSLLRRWILVLILLLLGCNSSKHQLRFNHDKHEFYEVIKIDQANKKGYLFRYTLVHYRKGKWQRIVKHYSNKHYEASEIIELDTIKGRF